MITLLTIMIYVVAVAVQAWLMWRIDRRLDNAKAEFLASLYFSLIVAVVFVVLRLVRGEVTLKVDQYGFGAMFLNVLLYTSVGLADRPTRRAFTPYIIYSTLIDAGVCLFAWWVAIGSRTLQ